MNNEQLTKLNLITSEHSKRIATIGLELLTALESAQSENDRCKAAIWGAVNQMDSDPLNANGKWETGMFCGLEDVGITDRYMACRYGYDRALEKVQEWIIDGLIEALKPEQELPG